MFTPGSAQIVQIAEQQKLLLPEEKPDDTALLRCLMAGFIDQLCLRRDAGTLDCDLTEGRTATLVRESVVQNSPLFVAAGRRGGGPRSQQRKSHQEERPKWPPARLELRRGL